jgi:hypothetical protein
METYNCEFKKKFLVQADFSKRAPIVILKILEYKAKTTNATLSI